MASRTVLCALLLLGSSACRESPAPAPAASPDPTPGGGAVAGPPPATTAPGGRWVLEVHDGTGKGGPLSLAALTRLVIEASVRGAPGRHPLRIDVLGPGGSLYAQLRSALVTSADGSGSASQVLEVDGTPIEAFHMTGKWQFVLSTSGGGGLATASLDVVD